MCEENSLLKVICSLKGEMKNTCVLSFEALKIYHSSSTFNGELIMNNYERNVDYHNYEVNNNYYNYE